MNEMRKYPVFVGMQPMTTGWHKDFSPGLLAKLDYVLMDPQTIPTGNGQYMRIGISILMSRILRHLW